MGVPLSFVRGETVVWEDGFADYPASSGWTLTYCFRGTTEAAQFDVVAATGTDGRSFKTTLTSSLTATVPVGRYDWQAYVEKDGVRHYVGFGWLQLLQDFATSTAVDNRTQNEKTLALIDEAIAGRFPEGVASYSISTGSGSRSLAKMQMGELLEARKYYAALVARERRIASGNPFGVVKHKFVKP